MKTTTMTGIDGKRVVLMTPSIKDVAGLAWRPTHAGYAVPFAEIMDSIINPTPRGLVVKGGPGSGNHDHEGIPGHQGGSKPKRGRSLNRIRRDSDDPADLAEQKKVFDYLNNGDDWQVKQPIDQETLLYEHEPPAGRAEALKESVAKALAKDLGVSESLASDFIHDWAATSNGFHLASLTHQRLSAERFGSVFSEWQQGRLFEAWSWRKHRIKLFAEKMFASGEALDANEVIDQFQTSMRKWEDLSLMGSTFPFESKMLEELAYGDSLGTMRSADDFIAFMKGTEEKSLDLTRKAIDSTYNRTQADLAANGIESLTLYRGTTLPNEGAVSSYDIGLPILASSNALSSWSASEHIADTRFAKVETGKRRQAEMGVVQVLNIPASRVYASPRTGPGCLADWEFILIGSAAPEEMQVLTVYRDERRTLYKAAIFKGGEGSGNHGHQGIPGHQGGSKPTGSADTAGSGRTGRREGWETHRKGLMFAYGEDYGGMFIPREVKQNKCIAILDDLSQDEMVDLFNTLFEEPFYNWNITHDDAVTAAADAWDWVGLEKAMAAIEESTGEERYDRRRVMSDSYILNLISSRLDEEHAESLFDAIASKHEKAIENAVRLADGTINWRDYKNAPYVNKMALDSLMTFGPSHAFRKAAYERLVTGALKEVYGGNAGTDNAALISGDIKEATKSIVGEWVQREGGDSNAWLQAGILKEFGGTDSVSAYWHPDYNGIIFKDPDPGFGKAVRAIYEDTQAFYVKKKQDTFPLFRGVQSRVTVRSPLESWSKAISTAKKFDGEAIFERQAHVSEVFMSWESMKGIFPAEKDLKGKKEMVLLGLDWLHKR